MRFGMRLGPFWVSTSTRRRRRRPTQLQEDRAAREDYDARMDAELRRVERMSPEEFRRYEEETGAEYREPEA